MFIKHTGFKIYFIFFIKNKIKNTTSVHNLFFGIKRDFLIFETNLSIKLICNSLLIFFYNYRNYLQFLIKNFVIPEMLKSFI